MKSSVCALVLGGYVNGYSVIRELSGRGLSDIWLFDYCDSLASKSNKIKGFSKIDKTPESLKENLFKLRCQFDYIVLFPTDDLQLELISQVKDEILEFCFIPFNCDNVAQSLDKNYQYRCCDELGIPYPKTFVVDDLASLGSVSEARFPIILKPTKRCDLSDDVFRNLYLNDVSDLYENSKLIENYVDSGIVFLASEYVPGDDTNIFAYTGYRSKNGVILNEWIGRKLNQFPNSFGVFSSACNESPEIVRNQGRLLVEKLELYGISEPEFKYDYRDNTYKLMEINLRSMMWHRVGSLSGVDLHYSQWLDSIGLDVPSQKQSFSVKIHFIYMKHEIMNLLSRRGYCKYFYYNVFKSGRSEFAVYNYGDIKPFFYDLRNYPRSLAKIWLKPLLIRLGKKLKKYF